jgi:hypothetical protein
MVYLETILCGKAMNIRKLKVGDTAEVDGKRCSVLVSEFCIVLKNLKEKRSCFDRILTDVLSACHALDTEEALYVIIYSI